MAGYSYQQRTTNYSNNRLSTYILIIISACSNFSQRCWIRGCRNLIYQHEKSFFLSPLMVFLEIFLKNRNMYISRYESKLKFFFVFIYSNSRNYSYFFLFNINKQFFNSKINVISFSPRCCYFKDTKSMNFFFSFKYNLSIFMKKKNVKNVLFY